MAATDELVSYANSLRYQDLPPQTVEGVKTAILDTIGAIMAGSAAEGPKKLVNLIQEWGGRAEGTIFVYGDKVPLPNAAWVNTTMSRGFDFETLAGGGATHVPACIIPAAFAISEFSQAFKNKVINGRELIVAIALGNDLNVRFRRGAGRNTQIGGGWLAETFAPPAIAALGGKLLGFDREKINYAMGIAYNQCCGTYGATVGLGGGLMAQVSQGLGTKAGVLSVLLADRGFTAYKDMIDGRWGLYRMYANGKYDPEILLGGLGRQFESLNNPSIKRYPGCGGTQAVVYGALELAREYDIRAENVAKVSLTLTEQNYWLLGEGKGKPLNTADALWNDRYSIAVALLKGKLSVDDFSEEAIKDPEVLELVERVEMHPDESGRGPELEIKTKDGKLYQKNKFAMPPMSRAEILEKFRGCNRFSAKPLQEQKVERFIQVVDKLEEMKNVTELIGMIS